MIRRIAAMMGLLGALAMPILARPVAAATPSPLASTQFVFPGSTANPASAVSAGLALADRWLGDDPFANPASDPDHLLALSGTMLRLSRQDLRAANRNFDQTPAFFDGAGLALRLPTPGRYRFSIYGFQPVLYREANAYSRGRGAPDPGAPPPATIEATASARELRAGGTASTAFGQVRVGVGVEWIRRQDAYEVIEHSGNPAAGATRLELSGDGVGFQLGARLDRGDSSVGGMSVGVGIRRLTALAVDAPYSQPPQLGVADTTLPVERESGWEVGSSARVAVSSSFRALAAVGGRTAQRWEGLDLIAGRAWEWKLAAEYHDARDPWTLRFGLGQERQEDAPEPRADVLGLGYGRSFTWGVVDVGLTHRTVHREIGPQSFEDRVVLTFRSPR